MKKIVLISALLTIAFAFSLVGFVIFFNLCKDYWAIYDELVASTLTLDLTQKYHSDAVHYTVYTALLGISCLLILFAIAYIIFSCRQTFIDSFNRTSEPRKEAAKQKRIEKLQSELDELKKD